MEIHNLVLFTCYLRIFILGIFDNGNLGCNSITGLIHKVHTDLIQ